MTAVSDKSTEQAGRRDERKGRFEFNKLRKRLRRQVGKAIADFNLVEPGIVSWCASRAARTPMQCWSC